jgi:uncharacterized protein (TIGR02996 family)
VRPLERARAAARAAQPVEALGALLEAWAVLPLPALAELVTVASTVAPPTATGLRGRKATAIAAWAQLARAPAATEIPALLDGLADVLWADAMPRLAMIARWPADPRVDVAIVELLETVPYRSTSQPFWRALLALARRITNPALLARLEAADALIETNVSATLGDWLRRHVARLVRELRPVLGRPAGPPPAILREIAEALGALARTAAPRRELADLLQSIHDVPGDDARRLVYADALLERGDPRGELIALQCRGLAAPATRSAGDRAGRRREKQLLDTHGKTWLGELAPVVMAGYRFERGFLSACRVDSTRVDRIRRVIGHPAWSTVRELDGSALIGLHPIMRSLRVFTFHPNRARRDEELGDAWHELLQGTARPIECLHYTDRDMYGDLDDQLAALGTCTALPALRQLVLGEAYLGVALPQVLAMPVLRRVEVLGFTLDRYSEFPYALLAAARPVVPTLRVVSSTVALELERVDAVYARARLEVAARTAREAAAIIAGLPASVKELRIALHHELARADQIQLAAALRARPQLVVSGLG